MNWRLLENKADLLSVVNSAKLIEITTAPYRRHGNQIKV